MRYVKFSSIYNADDTSYRTQFQDVINNPKERWIITEKIDGCNFSIIVDDKGNYQFGSRSEPLDSSNTTALYGLLSDISIFSETIAALKRAINSYYFGTDVTQLVIYGEWFGPGIMRRIDYGDKKQFRFFALRKINYRDQCSRLSYQDLTQFLHDFNLEKFAAPKVAELATFDDALRFNSTFDTRIGASGQQAEGFIITPKFAKTNFAVKVKSSQFLETRNKPKISTAISRSQLAVDLHQAFLQYITLNRMLSVFSKFGEPNASDAGRYIKAFVEDAFIDFCKDYPQYDTIEDKAEQKYVINAGSEPFKLFKQALSSYSK